MLFNSLKFKLENLVVGQLVVLALVLNYLMFFKYTVRSEIEIFSFTVGVRDGLVVLLPSPNLQQVNVYLI